MLDMALREERKVDESQSSKNVVKTNMHIYDASRVLLSTAIIEVFDERGGVHACRIRLDNGSQPNIISQDLVNNLKLRKKRLNVAVEVVNNLETPCREWASVRLKSKNSSYQTRLDFLILPQITGNVPANIIDKSSLNIPQHVTLADPEFYCPGKIEALIGAEVFYELLMEGKIKLSRPGILLQNTRLGWIVTGKLGGTWNQTSVRCHLVRNTIDQNLEKFWRLEETDQKIYHSKEEMACEKHFEENIRRTISGRYTVRLPFTEKKQDLGRSYEAARRRFFALERKLDRNEKLKEDYLKFMREYEELGHMERTLSGPDEGYYMPHQAVIRESSLTTKLRVVFDASAKTTTGISLNDSLMTGATIQDGIFQLIMRFRSHAIVLTGDIEKMYRQFLVHPLDRPFQKILWRETKAEPLRTCQLRTVTYGTASAPFLATRCLRQLALDERSSFPLASEILKNDFYVDDLLTGAESLEMAKKLKDELVQLTKKAGLNLTKWNSNHPELTEVLEDSVENRQVKIDPEQTTRTLGVCWNPKEDTLRYEVPKTREDENTSKRVMLSKTAQLYDPLGLLAPVIILAKIMLQELWRLSLDWDDQVPQELETTWKEYQSQLKLLESWKIERMIGTLEVEDVQLHGFSDASMRAYGACIYLRVPTKEGFRAILVCAKSRVAPIKTVPLPRLELCGAVLLAKLYVMVRDALKLKIASTRFWCDSMITLAWIRSSPHRREIFIANRVAQIQELTNGDDWIYVPTKENPADFVSRGQLPSHFLENKMWKAGPHWLSLPEENWPKQDLRLDENTENENTKITTLVAKTNQPSELWSRFSSLRQLLRFVAYSLRFLNNTRKKEKVGGFLSTHELTLAWRQVVRLVQQEEFTEEIYSLSHDGRISGNSKLNRLNPVIEDGLLRVGGRIQNADVGFDTKQPILLPKKHLFTELVIKENHAKLMHAGINATLYAVRELYWIVDGRAAVRRVLHACIRCFRAKPKEEVYKMGNLPKVRMSTVRPFENTGVDFCGPFFIKEKKYRNKNKIKVYVAVFICLSIRAIHLELVGELTTEAFLGCLRRFFARRGKAGNMYSDNGTNFVGANNELKELHCLLESRSFQEKTVKYCTDENIQWHFAPPRTPHFGGIWEAAVKSLKHHLRRTVRDTLFGFEELSTYICEIEAILNSRPISPMSSDPNDLEALTPGHFLIGKKLSSIPSPELETIKINRLSAWQHLQKLR